MNRLTVSPEIAGERVDKALVQLEEGQVSRTQVRRGIDAGCVRVNGKLVKAHTILRAGDVLEWAWPERDTDDSAVLPEKIPLSIVYEDPWIVVVNKPAGMLVHPARGQKQGTVVNALLAYHHDWALGKDRTARPGIVHRLDRETSGVLITVRDEKTHRYFTEQFAQRKIDKRYVALVKGHVEFDEGVIEAPLGRHPRHFDRRAVSQGPDAREAVTYYRVLVRKPDQTTLLALFPRSGRTHQLRVHMAHLGHPILGDRRYGYDAAFPRMALHAEEVAFRHPYRSCRVEIRCPYPKEWRS